MGPCGCDRRVQRYIVHRYTHDLVLRLVGLEVVTGRPHFNFLVAFAFSRTKLARKVMYMVFYRVDASTMTLATLVRLYLVDS